MTCDDVRRHLLEAPPERVRPPTGSDLERHLAACPRCRRATALVEGGRRELEGWLATPPPPLDVAILLERARDEHARGTGKGRAPRSRRRAGVRWALGVGVPLAAAAGLAALLLPGSPPGPGGRLAEGTTPAAPDPGLALEVPAGRDAAVIETSNPDITVVWFFSGD